MLVSQLYKETETQLADAKIVNPSLVARAFIATLLGLNDYRHGMSADAILNEQNLRQLESWVSRAKGGEPYTKIIQEAEFYGLRFYVTNDVLDPRPDTETIIEAVQKRYKDKNAALRFLDLGTGSGCLIITLLKLYPNANGMAVDISEKALDVARRNQYRHDLSARLVLKQSDWMDKVEGVFDVIVSNPPYIANHEMANLSENVRKYDPNLALVAGDDGLDAYKKIFSSLKSHLVPTGFAFFEIGFSQHSEVVRLGMDTGVLQTYTHADLAGTARVVEISFGEK
jgi:release factor glutamine methyltransferase